MATPFQSQCAELLLGSRTATRTVAIGQARFNGSTAKEFDDALRIADGVMYSEKCAAAVIGHGTFAYA